MNDLRPYFKQMMKRIHEKSVAKGEGEGEKECCKVGGGVGIVPVRTLKAVFTVFFFYKFTGHVRVRIFHTSHGLRSLCVENPH